ncbi:NUDIX hydrolase [Roseateles oligotrophus]|uniref:Phosphatase NudJ n=1 Tax=Roseateles oligotrophus TaxID=1769250 RepID=A0ABT2YJY9_9BURK|nr:NUDIX hydrolase [Roseateles oligotrophus]MCV2370240.1 NUDIX hydrolase [Roseateles oligotrophus]
MSNNSERWKPAVTVAAVIEQDGRFLLVEEETPEGLQLNNPAGHLDPGESPLEGVVREALEETARDFVPEALLGIYMARFERKARLEDVTYVRLAFCGRVGEEIAGRTLDHGIHRTLWMTVDEIRANATRHRSPLVLRCIEDYLAGKRLPLDAIHIDPSLYSPLLKA